jgi:hypothetical protein
MVKHPLHQTAGCFRILQGNVIREGVEVAQRKLRPNHLNYRAVRFLASA